MAREFSSIQTKTAKRDHNKFDLSYDVCETNDLCIERPIFVRECVPSDKFKVNVSTATRFGSMVAPTFGRINVNYHAFFVPYRLIFKDWSHFWDGTKRGIVTGTRPSSSDALLPYITPAGILRMFASNAILLPQQFAIGETTVGTSSDVLKTVYDSFQQYCTEHPIDVQNFDIVPYACATRNMLMNHLCYEVPADAGYDFLIPSSFFKDSQRLTIYTSKEDGGPSISYLEVPSKQPENFYVHVKSKNLSYSSAETSFSAQLYNATNKPVAVDTSTHSVRCLRYTPLGRQVMSLLRSLGYDINLFSAVGGYIPNIAKKDGKYYTSAQLYVTSTISQYATAHLNALPLLAWVRVYTDYLKNRKGSAMDEFQKLFESDFPNMDAWLFSNSDIVKRLVYVYYSSDYFTSSMKAPLDYDNLTTPSSEFSFYSRSFDTDGSSGGYSNVIASVNDNNSVGSFGFYQKSGSATPMQGLDGNLLTAVQACYSYALRNNLAGQRYADRLRARFGISPSSSRLDMVEMLNHSSSPIYVNDVMSNATTLNPDGSTNTDLGDYGGKCENSSEFTFGYQAPEFGILICTYNITPKGRYPYGIDYSVLRTDRSQFFNPEFDGLATRSIRFSEMIAPHLQTSKSENPNNSTFGYTPTYAEYKIGRDRNNGDFCRISSANDLESYSFSRSNSAKLIMNIDRVGLEANNNEEFLSATQDMISYYNIFNDTGIDYDHLFVYHGVSCIAYRPMCKLFDLQGITGGSDITIKPFGNNV